MVEMTKKTLLGIVLSLMLIFNWSIPVLAAVTLDQSVMIVIDASGSMASNSKIDEAKLAANYFLDSVTGKNVEVGLIVFYDAGDIRLLNAMTTNLDAVRTSIATIQPEYSTPLAASIKMGVDELVQYHQASKGKVLVMTDGGENCGGDPVAAAEYLKQLEYDYNFDMSMDIIGIDIDDQTVKDQETDAANTADGSFIDVQDPSQLPDIFKTIGENINITGIALNPQSVSLKPGETLQLAVTATKSDGTTEDITKATTCTTYDSSDSSVAVVDADGLISIPANAVVGSTADITVRNNGISQVCKITVVSTGSDVLSSIAIDPQSCSLIAGASQQLSVKATMGDGSTKDVTNSSNGTVYTTSNAKVAAVDANGLVTVPSTAVIGAKATITATNGGMTSTSTITAIADSATVLSSINIDPKIVTLGKGSQQQLTVTATMGDGSTKDVTSGSNGIVYTSTNTAAATVDANGLVTVPTTATGGDKSVITVQYGGKTISGTVTVASDITASSISINPTTATVAPGQQQQLAVTAKMSDGSTKDVTSGSEGTVYTSTNTAVATVDANGLITVLPTAANGDKCIVTVNYSGKILSSTITVDGGIALSSISVNPTSVSLMAGQQQQLAVTATMSDGSTKDVTNASEGTVYSSSSTSQATVDANGLITVPTTASIGAKPVISVTYGGKTVSCAVSVTGITLSSISTSPKTVTVAPGQQQQLSVTATMSDGSTQDVTSGSTYTSSNTSVATVDANGLITVLSNAAAGTKAIISAKYGTLTSSCTVTVGTGVTVSSIVVNPTTALIQQGQQQQLAVTATMSDGSTKDVISGSTYVSSNGVAVKVDANGLITIPTTATTGAKSTITITNGGKTATCVVTIGGGVTLSSISGNPTAVTLAPNQQQQLTITAKMSDGSTQDVTSVSTCTYTSSNTAVATVDANGLITVLSTATNASKAVISSKYNGYSASCTVTVAGALTLSSISVNPTSATIVQGQTKQLAVTATMSDGSTKDVTSGSTYASSNGVAVKVDASGLITIPTTALAASKSTITVTYGGKTASCVVTVGGTTVTLSSVSISPKTVTLTKGQQQQLTLTANMSDGSTKDVTSGSGTTYTSSNTALATVDANGLITVSSTAATGSKVVISGKYGSMAVSCTVTIG